MDDNKDDVKHMIPEDDVINLHDLLAHSAPTKSPEEFEKSTEDVELEADEKKVPVLGEEFISHHDVVAPSSSKRHTDVKIYEEGTYRYVVGRPSMSGPSTSSNYYGQIVNNVNTGQLRAVSSHDPSSSIAGRSQAPATFYCTLCRSNIPSAVYQLVVPSDPVPKEALRQLLLTKYGGSVVDAALKGDHPLLICRRHVEEETESASSTFFCTLCRSHIPSSVNQLVVTPGVKPNLRRILQNKFSACQVEEALKGKEQLLICRRHVEEEIDPTTPTFFCALCRGHVPESVHQLVVTPDPVCKETIRELLVKKYRELRMVQDALVGNAAVVICRHHVELDPNEVARRQHEPLLPKNDDKEVARRRSRDCMRRLRWTAARENTVNGGEEEEEVKPRRGRKRKCRQSYEDDRDQPTLPMESSEGTQELIRGAHSPNTASREDSCDPYEAYHEQEPDDKPPNGLFREFEITGEEWREYMWNAENFGEGNESLKEEPVSEESSSDTKIRFLLEHAEQAMLRKKQLESKRCLERERREKMKEDEVAYEEWKRRNRESKQRCRQAQRDKLRSSDARRLYDANPERERMRLQRENAHQRAERLEKRRRLQKERTEKMKEDEEAYEEFERVGREEKRRIRQAKRDELEHSDEDARRLQEERKLMNREKARLRLQREDADQRAERLARAAESQRIRRLHMGEAGRQEYKEYFRRWKERMTDQQRAEYTERRRLQRQRRMMNETDQEKEARLERARENTRNKARQREKARISVSLARGCEDLPEQRSEPAAAL